MFFKQVFHSGPQIFGLCLRLFFSILFFLIRNGNALCLHGKLNQIYVGIVFRYERCLLIVAACDLGNRLVDLVVYLLINILDLIFELFCSIFQIADTIFQLSDTIYQIGGSIIQFCSSICKIYRSIIQVRCPICKIYRSIVQIRCAACKIYRSIIQI